MSTIELTNMCMIIDSKNNKVLVQKRTKSWKGIAFPGGHVEDGEAITESVVREIKEETGLTITNLEFCGIMYWYNSDTKAKYFVFNYRTYDYSGELKTECDEGTHFWVNLAELPFLEFSPGLKERLPMFEKKYFEGFRNWSEQEVCPMKWF